MAGPPGRERHPPCDPTAQAPSKPGLRMRKTSPVRRVRPLPCPRCHPSPTAPSSCSSRTSARSSSRSRSALAREGFDPVARRARPPRRSRRRASGRRTWCCSTSCCRTATGATSAASCAAARDVPVIMLTARGTETDRIVGLELGADDYVVKPFSAPRSIARMRAVLRRTRRRRRPRRGAARERSTCGPLDVERGPPRVARRRRAAADAARSSTCWPSCCATPARSSRART